MSALTDLEAVISTVLAGYEASLHLYDPERGVPQYVIRQEGGLQPYPNIVGFPRFAVWIVVDDSSKNAGYLKALEVNEHIADNYAYGNIAGFRVLSDVSGPFPLGGNRYYFELNIDAIESRG